MKLAVVASQRFLLEQFEEFEKLVGDNQRMLNHILFTDLDIETDKKAQVSKVSRVEEVQEAICSFMAHIMTSIDVEIRQLVNTKHEGIIVTPVDTDSATGEGVNKLMERKLGRKLKNIGDMHVLRGNIQEAMVNYQQAIEETKSTEDWCWSSGAQIGKATALFLLQLHDEKYPESYEDIEYLPEIGYLLTGSVSDLENAKITQLEVES